MDKVKWFLSDYAIPVALTIILVMIAVFVLVRRSTDVCWIESSFECKNARVEACMKSEQYTKDQCVILIGGGK